MGTPTGTTRTGVAPGGRSAARSGPGTPAGGGSGTPAGSGGGAAIAVAQGPPPPGLTAGSARPAAATVIGPTVDDGMPGVAGQLVRVLSAPRPTPGGTYTVTVSLRPESLGAVTATVTAGQGQVSVRLLATTTDGADAIRVALPQLHQALSAEGQRATVSLAPGGSAGGGPQHSIGSQGGGQRSGGQQAGSQGMAGQSGWTPRQGSEPAARRTVAPAGGAVRPVEPTGPAGRPAPGGRSPSRLVDVRV
ncbi:MAG: flagellar hook-length control protein FliK [Acidimicrobiales bacterium]